MFCRPRLGSWSSFSLVRVRSCAFPPPPTLFTINCTACLRIHRCTPQPRCSTGRVLTLFFATSCACRVGRGRGARLVSSSDFPAGGSELPPRHFRSSVASSSCLVRYVIFVKRFLPVRNSNECACVLVLQIRDPACGRAGCSFCSSVRKSK